MNPCFQNKIAPTVFLAACILISGVYLVTAASVTNAPTRWPPLAEVLKKWDAESWDAAQKAADGGDLTAQHYLGYCYTEPHRVPQDSTLGAAWYLRAGDAGYAPSLSNLGFLYQRGKGVPQDYSKMLYYYHRAADAGYVPAHRFIGNLYRDGRGVQLDYGEAMKWFRRAADQGDTTAMAEVGRLYRFGQGVARDLDEAIRWLQKAAEKNDSLGKLNLGLLYEEEGNPQAAFKFYRQAAEQGLANAMFKLYQCYRNGVGVAVDRNEARKWLEKGAEAGSAWAQTELGYLYEYPPFDDDTNKLRVRYMFQAVKWYQRAADQKLADGQYYLGLCYLEGKGVEKDEEHGLELIRNAADQGHSRSVSELAELYARGVGEPRNSQDEPMQLLRRVAATKSDDEYWFFRAKGAYNEIIFRFQYGLGTQRDLIAAAHWYCRAALAGMEGYSLGDKVEVGHALKRPLAVYSGSSDRSWVLIRSPDAGKFSDEFLRVLCLYLQAAELKKPTASLQIAELYAAGRDVPKNPAKAWLWFTIAAQNGSADAHARIVEIESRMTSDELKEARQLLPGFVEELKQVASAMRGVSGRSMDQ